MTKLQIRMRQVDQVKEFVDLLSKYPYEMDLVSGRYTIVSFQTLIQPVVIHDLLYLAQQMVFRYQHIQIHDHCFFACVFSPLFHTQHPRFLYYTGNGGGWVGFLTS